MSVKNILFIIWAVSQCLILTPLEAGQPPVISSIGPQSTSEGVPITVAFTVSDAETAAERLTVTATSDTTSLLPSENILVSGSTNNRTLTLTPAPNQNGAATITLKVTDSDGASAGRSFVLTVNAFNSPPEITGVPDQSINENSATVVLNFYVADIESLFESLIVTGRSSNPALVLPTGIVVSGSGFERQVSVRPRTNEIGTATITLIVTDPGGATASAKFLLTVNAVNQRPLISGVPDAITVANSGLSFAIPFIITDAETPADKLVVTASASNTNLLPNANVSLSGNGTNRVLRITPVLGQTGTTTVTISAVDSGFATITKTFSVTIVVNPPQTQPNDFNGDGLADLMFQHRDGFLGVGFMNGTNLLTSTFFNPNQPGGTNWQLVGTGDYDHDGKWDLLFQHNDGTLAVWFMNGINQARSALLSPANPGANWRVVSVGDFNLDGNADLVLQHTNGSLWLWFLDGINLLYTVTLNTAGPGDKEWRVVGSGDFNGDGYLDLAFQHTNGSLAVWFMVRTRVIETALFSPFYPGSVNWRVVGIDDYDRDGKPDLLFEYSDGTLAAWLLDGIKLTKSTLLNPSNAGPGWRVAGPK